MLIALSIYRGRLAFTFVSLISAAQPGTIPNFAPIFAQIAISKIYSNHTKNVLQNHLEKINKSRFAGKK